MLRRTSHRGWKQYLDFLKFRSPKDEWVFEIDGASFLIFNSWNSGMQLRAQGKTIAVNRSLVSLNMKRPFLTASVVDHAGNSRQIEVFVRALLLIDIRVAVDGTQLSQAYV